MYGSQLGTRTCDSGCSFSHVLQAPNTQPYPEDCSTYDWGNEQGRHTRRGEKGFSPLAWFLTKGPRVP